MSLRHMVIESATGIITTSTLQSDVIRKAEDILWRKVYHSLSAVWKSTTSGKSGLLRPPIRTVEETSSVSTESELIVAHFMSGIGVYNNIIRTVVSNLVTNEGNDDDFMMVNTWNIPSSNVFSSNEKVRQIIHHSLICQGDLSRYLLEISSRMRKSNSDNGHRSGSTGRRVNDRRRVPDHRRTGSDHRRHPVNEYRRSSDDTRRSVDDQEQQQQQQQQKGDNYNNYRSPYDHRKLAQHYYMQAIKVNPDIGMPLNQLGTLTEKKSKLEAIYYYMKCLSSKVPFDGAESNLKRITISHASKSDVKRHGHDKDRSQGRKVKSDRIIKRRSLSAIFTELCHEFWFNYPTATSMVYQDGTVTNLIEEYLNQLKSAKGSSRITFQSSAIIAMIFYHLKRSNLSDHKLFEALFVNYFIVLIESCSIHVNRIIGASHDGCLTDANPKEDAQMMAVKKLRSELSSSDDEMSSEMAKLRRRKNASSAESTDYSDENDRDYDRDSDRELDDMEEIARRAIDVLDIESDQDKDQSFDQAKGDADQDRNQMTDATPDIALQLSKIYTSTNITSLKLIIDVYQFNHILLESFKSVPVSVLTNLASFFNVLIEIRDKSPNANLPDNHLQIPLSCDQELIGFYDLMSVIDFNCSNYEPDSSESGLICIRKLINFGSSLTNYCPELILSNNKFIVKE